MKSLRKITALILAFVIAICGTCPAFAANTGSPAAVLASMTTEEKITQMLMPAFRYFTDENGTKQPMTELTEDSAELIKKYGFGGVVVFAQNCADTEKAVTYIEAMQRANAAHKTQLLVACDQEGGSVNRLGHGTMTPGNMALGAANDPALTAEAAKILGREMLSMGINFDFAPVLDVNVNPANPVIGIRSFSDDPAVVAKHGEAFIKALHSVGVIDSVKHFPGHGDNDTDSHTGLPMIDRSYEELKERELIPFKAAIDAGAEAVMTAHIQFPKIEKATYVSKLTGEEIYLPATLSKTIITDILRKDMGFKGVVVADALNMDAIAKHFDRYDVTKLAVEAGVDILLMPVDISTKEGMAELEDYIKTLTAMVENGEISEKKVNESVLRILKLKEAHGQLKPYEGIDHNASLIVGGQENHDAEWEIIKKAVTLVKNDNDVLPLVGANDKVVVLTAYDNEVLSMEYASGRLADENKLAKGIDVSVHSIQKITAEEAIALTELADHVIVISELYSAAGFSDNYSKKVDAIIKSVHEAGGDVIIMSCHLPYDVARYPEADAVMITYSAKGMSEDPRETNGPAVLYGPNMPAALYLMLSTEDSPEGTLPVNIPALTSDMKYSDTILYPRGYGLTYNGSFTRAQFITRLWKGQGRPMPSAETVDPFTDVAEDAYYRDAVIWAFSEGITKGTTLTTFNPDRVCKESEQEAFLRRLNDSYRYEHDPRENPSAMKDIVLDRDAVYGFSPSPSGSLKQYAAYDWTDPVSVAEWQKERIEYHKSLESLYEMIAEMQANGSSVEETARAVSKRRNELRLEAAHDEAELAIMKDRNLEKYGHEEGPLPDELYEKYGSWEMVMAKAMSTNSGMDACLGLYDTYYNVYVSIGQIE